MNTEQAINKFEFLYNGAPERNIFYGFDKRELWKHALDALREKQERLNPQPLTLNGATKNSGQWGRCPKCNKLNRYENNYCANCGIRICPPNGGEKE